MENKVKVEKFYDLKEKFEALAVDYKKALETDDKEAIKNLNKEYNDLKVVLYSSKNYFKEQSNVEYVKTESTFISSYLRNKEYKDNKSYIEMVKKSKSLKDYIKNSGRKEFNLVNRNFHQKGSINKGFELDKLELGTDKFKLLCKYDIKIFDTTEIILDKICQDTTVPEDQKREMLIYVLKAQNQLIKDYFQENQTSNIDEYRNLRLIPRAHTTQIMG